MQTLKVGDVTITSIIERDGPWRKPEDICWRRDPHRIGVRTRPATGKSSSSGLQCGKGTNYRVDGGANPVAKHFADGLRELGYVEPQLIVEWRSAEGKAERLPDIIAELLALKVDVIVTVTNAMTRIAREMTRTVPIFMAHSRNPVEEGLIQSFARPGGNVTGLTSSAGDAELLAKRLQLLKEMLPGISRVAFLQSEDESVAGAKRIQGRHRCARHPCSAG
jgi:hypothetical protein